MRCSTAERKNVIGREVTLLARKGEDVSDELMA